MTQKHLREAVAALRQIGFTVVDITQSRHYRITVEPEFVFILQTTTSDTRAMRNFIAYAKRTYRGLAKKREPATIPPHETDSSTPRTHQREPGRDDPGDARHGRRSLGAPELHDRPAAGAGPRVSPPNGDAP